MHCMYKHITVMCICHFCFLLQICSLLLLKNIEFWLQFINVFTNFVQVVFVYMCFTLLFMQLSRKVFSSLWCSAFLIQISC
jgi:hypothetical protein